MIVQAILLGLIAFIGKCDLATGTNMIQRPIVLGPLVGLVLGDLQAGITIGATLELFFLGAVSVGAYIPPNVIVGGVLGTAFAISTGQGTEGHAHRPDRAGHRQRTVQPGAPAAGTGR